MIKYKDLLLCTYFDIGKTILTDRHDRYLNSGCKSILSGVQLKQIVIKNTQNTYSLRLLANAKILF